MGICFPLIHSIVSNDSISRQERHWSDCTDAQTELGLHCPHMPEDTFFHAAAHIPSANKYARGIKISYIIHSTNPESCYRRSWHRIMSPRSFMVVRSPFSIWRIIFGICLFQVWPWSRFMHHPFTVDPRWDSKHWTWLYHVTVKHIGDHQNSVFKTKILCQKGPILQREAIPWKICYFPFDSLERIANNKFRSYYD